MHSNNPQAALRDIVHHIDLALGFIAGLDYEAFRSDLRTLYAVTRCLEIISEASRRLPDEIKTRHPDIAWRAIAAAGNVFRHEYEDVSSAQVWETMHRALPSLRAAIAPEIAGADRP